MEQKRFLAGLLPDAEGADEMHGAFITLVRPDATRLAGRLAEHGVKVDARGSYLRICPDYLNSRAELERAALLVQNLSAR